MLKKKLTKEGSQLYEKIVRLKITVDNLSTVETTKEKKKLK